MSTSNNFPSVTEEWLAEIGLTADDIQETVKRKKRSKPAPTKDYKEDSQYFTHPDWAERIVAMYWNKDDVVLEPSAGDGAFAQFLPRATYCVEKHPELAEKLHAYSDNVLCADFLSLQEGDLPKFDLIIGNTPYEKKMDQKFVLHALKFLKPGGKIVFIFQTKFLNSRTRAESLFCKEVLLSGVFPIPRSSIIYVGEHGPMRDYAVFEMRKRTKRVGEDLHMPHVMSFERSAPALKELMALPFKEYYPMIAQVRAEERAEEQVVSRLRETEREAK